MDIVFWLDSQTQELDLLSYRVISTPYSSQLFTPLSLEITNLMVFDECVMRIRLFFLLFPRQILIIFNDYIRFINTVYRILTY